MAHIWKKGFRVSVIDRDGHKCRYCGKSGLYKRALTLDHLVPVVRGGKDELSNVVVSCMHCNCKKGKKSVEQYIPHRLKELERERETLELLLSNL